MQTIGSELKELISKAPEKPLFTIRRYDGIIINPRNTDNCDSGYRDLELYGVIKSENGILLEKITITDVLTINSFFKKLKGFEILIDIPYPENFIHISCHNYLIEVDNHGFKFVKDSRKTRTRFDLNLYGKCPKCNKRLSRNDSFSVSCSNCGYAPKIKYTIPIIPLGDIPESIQEKVRKTEEKMGESGRLEERAEKLRTEYMRHKINELDYLNKRK